MIAGEEPFGQRPGDERRHHEPAGVHLDGDPGDAEELDAWAEHVAAPAGDKVPPA